MCSDGGYDDRGQMCHNNSSTEEVVKKKKNSLTSREGSAN